jgi:hypothetical protein
VVVKLQATGDERWYHRPAVAVGPAGDLRVLTEGFVRVSEARILADLNSIAAQEVVSLSDVDLHQYAAFFLNLFLVNSDFRCLRATLPESGALEQNREDLGAICSGAEMFRLSRHSDGIQIDTALVDRKGRWAQPFRFILGRDGTIRREPS